MTKKQISNKLQFSNFEKLSFEFEFYNLRFICMTKDVLCPGPCEIAKLLLMRSIISQGWFRNHWMNSDYLRIFAFEQAVLSLFRQPCLRKAGG
jgi:hypothetical protein